MIIHIWWKLIYWCAFLICFEVWCAVQCQKLKRKSRIDNLAHISRNPLIMCWYNMRYNTSDSTRSHMIKTVMLVYLWWLLWSPRQKIDQKEAIKPCWQLYIAQRHLEWLTSVIIWLKTMSVLVLTWLRVYGGPKGQ